MPYPGKQKFGQFEQLVRIHYREISMYEETYLYHGIAEILESAEVEDAADYVITMKPKSALERILETKGGVICSRIVCLQILLTGKRKRKVS